MSLNSILSVFAFVNMHQHRMLNFQDYQLFSSSLKIPKTTDLHNNSCMCYVLYLGYVISSLFLQIKLIV